MEGLFHKEDKSKDVLYHVIMLYRRIEKEGGNGIKEFLRANKRNSENPFGYKFKAETILGIKKAIIYYNDKFEIMVETECAKCGFKHEMNQKVVDEKERQIIDCCINCAHKYKLKPISDWLKGDLPESY